VALTPVAVAAPLRRSGSPAHPGFRLKGLRLDGALWQICCGLTDKRRIRGVPPPVVTPEPAPVTATACLDPLFLADPAGFYPAPPPVRPLLWETLDELDGVERERLVFPSHVPFGISANDQVTVYFYRPAAGRPFYSLLILPGIWRRDRRFEDRLCRELARQGVSCALLTLPFHWERAPAGVPDGAYFVSADPLWTAAAFRQAVVDARGVLGLLRGRGAPVGVVGFSLGGIIGHMLMALERLDLGVLALAGGNIAAIVWESLLTQRHRQAMEARGVTLSRLAALWAIGDPTRHAWRARPPRVLMVNAQYDLLVPRAFTDELWHALGSPPIRWLPAGHITAFLFRQTMVSEILAATGVRAPVAGPGPHGRNGWGSGLVRRAPG
jgi:dienelactone hydrolase